MNPDALPLVTIANPASGSEHTETYDVLFSGTASDPEDGDLTATIAWSSSLDGDIGTGASFSTSTLSLGTHTITASADRSRRRHRHRRDRGDYEVEYGAAGDDHQTFDRIGDHAWL